MVINLVDLKLAMGKVIERLDHRNIDKDVDEFRNGKVSTAENLAVYFYQKLSELLPPGLLYEIKLHETTNNVVFYRGE